MADVIANLLFLKKTAEVAYMQGAQRAGMAAPFQAECNAADAAQMPGA